MAINETIDGWLAAKWAGAGTALGGIIGAFVKYGPLWFKKEPKKSMRQTVEDLKEQVTQTRLDLAGINGSMVTKDDINTLVLRMVDINRETATTMTDALAAGMNHVHERISEVDAKQTARIDQLFSQGH